MDDAANSRIIKDAIESDGDVRAIFARLSGLIGLHLLAKDGGKAVEAVDLITRAIEMEPQDGELYRERGLAYIAEKDFERAVRDLSQAIRLAPDNIEYYGIRGSVYIQKGEYDNAIDDLARVRRDDGGGPGGNKAARDGEKNALYLSIAYVLRSLRNAHGGDLEAARLDFENAEAIAGSIEEVSGKFREAHGLFRELKGLLGGPARLR
ncbi:MAG: hypothetical protein A2X35_00235 [Elusimicrobia bacterium GWA2_61_42]|nr:MAG: hypothetical protein A2X35_00235 [Elusimicrobia bacterium GWA2_61_42]OGR74523.1 MAG: hypothetical protein A2X38_07985 [Elusimicrobia bacterium GWC2_61_25]